ncbi:polysaccharide pyruvyl transferase family protein [Novosphingobium sp. BW1]|uniref:polysaccharide pyruvyl transferase family protein n=1 Tax=Novosphingobium sp. BW1 TaxID=2592621 RepID=UPI0013968017|nr:polysaccharide pyruvyl transferase family protein [Novosphingobium sp. BW1]
MNVLLHGSYFGLNFGDTLLCRLFSDWIHAADANSRVILPRADARNLKLIGSDERGLLAARKGEALVLCGGGYFGEPKSGITRWTARAYTRHMLLANWAAERMPVYIFGTGVGPVTNPRMRRDLIALFQRAEVAVVRDQESANFLKEWGVTRDLQISPDAVVTATESDLKKDIEGKDLSMLRFANSEAKTVAVHTEVHASGRDLDIAKDMVARLIAETNHNIVLVTDGRRTFGDSAWHDQVNVPEEAKKRVVKLKYDGDPQSLIAVLNAVDIVITTKLHVGIVRCALNKPVISIPRHAKTPRFYRQMQLEDWCLSTNEEGWQQKVLTRLADWNAGLEADFTHFNAVRSVGYYRDRLKANLAPAGA